MTLMRRFLIAAMVLSLSVPALAATVAHSSLHHRRAPRHSAHVAHARVTSAHQRYLQRLRAEREARRAPLSSHARLRYAADRRYSHSTRRPEFRHAVLASSSRHSYYRRFARVSWVSPLRGSRASLLRQNQRDDAEGLVRIQDEAQLLDLESAGKLVPIPVSAALRVNPSLPPDRRYCRPWTALFLAALARSHYARFHRPIEIDSAVRTVEFQRHLELINGNAAPAEGDLASPHLTGAAIDIAKKGMTFSEIAWMRGWLLPIQTDANIDVEEEFRQACFHIDVYRSYTRTPAAPDSDSDASLLATGVN